ncbi:MAG: efflux RND transporter periplasmic adaptor subunit, partial [Spartobacteria bacterium]|nr:efflux RND transporter periplasmic adaptor subunit [Spartobacteria bacterium]
GERPTVVRTVVSRVGDLERSRTYLGVVEPLNQATIAARVSADVSDVLVREGDAVTNGQLLVVLDDREIQAGIAAASVLVEQLEFEQKAHQANVFALQKSITYADKEADRYRDLEKKEAVAVSAMEKIIDNATLMRGRLESLQHQASALEKRIEGQRHHVQEWETRLSYCQIVSPYNGMITQRSVDPGDLATVGKTLLVVEDSQDVTLTCQIPQTEGAQLIMGLPVTFLWNETIRTAHVDRIYPSLNASRLLTVESTVKNSAPALKTGSYVPMTLVLSNVSSATLIPTDALVTSGDRGSFVFAVEDDRLKMMSVTPLGQSGDWVAVSGLSGDTEVVCSTYLGWATLSSGLNVKAVQ